MRVPGPILRTERLYLQTPRLRDVGAIYTWVRDPRVTRHLSWESPSTPDETAAFVAHARRQQRAGHGLVYVLHERATRQAIGCCGVHDLNRAVHHRAELGYWLARPYWGRGLVSEALRALIAHAFTRLELRRVYAYVFTRNARSTHLLETLGFQCEGTLRKHHCKQRQPRDSYLYGLLATDPAARALRRGA